MGVIFDRDIANIYENWCRSPQGRAMDRLVERSLPALLDPMEGERVLDIGCGLGNHLLFLKDLGLDVCGVDASSYLIKRARERLGNRCALHTARAEDLPFDDNEFDFAVLINTLEFLDHPLQALREAGRVSRRAVFVGAMNSFSWNCISHKLRGPENRSPLHQARFYNLWELKAYMRIAFGNVPIGWRCSSLWPSILEKAGRLMPGDWNFTNCPFGSFLTISAKIMYRVRTNNLHLKLAVKKRGEPVIGGLSVRKGLPPGGIKIPPVSVPRNNGALKGERGLSL